MNSRSKIDMLIGIYYFDFYFSLEDIRGKQGQGGPALEFQTTLQLTGSKINTAELILA